MATLRDNMFRVNSTYNRGPGEHRQEKEAISGIGKLLSNMAMGPDPGDNALFLQRLGLAKKYGAETAGQELLNKLTGYKASETERALKDPKVGDLGLLGRLGIANPGDALDYAKAQSEQEFRPFEIGRLEDMKKARGMFLPEDPDAKLNRQFSALERGELLQPEGGGVTPRFAEGDLMRAFNLLSGKTTGAGDSFTLADKMGVRATAARPTVAEQALADQRAEMTPAMIDSENALAEMRRMISPEKSALAEQIIAMTPEKIESEKASREPALALAEQRREMTPHLVGKTIVEKTEILAKVDNILNNMELAEAESMQTQQKLITENKLAEAKIQEVEVKTNNSKKVATETILKLQAAKALHWAGVDKIISAIANNDMQAALDAIKTVEETNTEKLEGQHEQQEINKVKALINNIKATGKQDKAFNKIRVKKEQSLIDLASARTTAVEVTTPRKAALLEQQTATSAADEKSKIASTMLTETKDRAEEYKLFEDMKDGLKSSTKKGDTDDPLAKAMGTQSGKLSAPLKVVDVDDEGIEYSLQPSMKMALADAMKKTGETGAFEYLRSLGKSPRAQIHLLAAQFGWTNDKKEAFLEAIEE